MEERYIKNQKPETKFFRDWTDKLWFVLTLALFVLGLWLAFGYEGSITEDWMGWVLYFVLFGTFPILVYKYATRRVGR